MPQPLPDELRTLQAHVEKAAREYGLDGFEIIYEMLDYDEINMVAAYCGFPVRYPHWRWGMEYDRLKKSHEYGLNKIYEMVINNDPCYAYLLESNAYIDQKLVMCHVAGHNDFFRHNFAFAHTNRTMVNEMANHASRIRHYMDWHGVNQVESFIDCVLSLENLIDVHSPYIVRQENNPEKEAERYDLEQKVVRIPTTNEYMDPYLNPKTFIDGQKERLKGQDSEKEKRFPKEPYRDVLAFLIEYAPLKSWQADVIGIIRKEAYYFAPQAMTKIMNEGWASYWHAKLMTERMMEPNELIDFADRHSSVTQSTPQSLNPYKLGLELFRDIEERWNVGRFGSEYDNCSDMAQRSSWNRDLQMGRKKIFDVRKIYNDLTFIDEFLTIEFCQQHGLFTYAFDKRKHQYVIESRDFKAIKDRLLQSLTNLGHPIIQVENGNFDNRSELLLKHVFHGVPLDLSFAKETLKNLARLWSRPVHIETQMDERKVCLSHDGEKFYENTMAPQI